MGTKYEPLELYLRNKPKSIHQVRMSFNDIEKIIANSLPRSAYEYRAWWGNQKNTKNRPQAKSWLDAGFEVETVSQQKTTGSVLFLRKRKF